VRVLFQPHRFSRTKHLLDDFATAFHQAGDLYVLDIYAASEQALEGVTAQALVDRIASFGHRSAHYVANLDEGIEAIVKASEPGDLIITLGAGSVSQAAEKILQRLRERS
jgi:UDP-N-acetylmuramate--alanine ligase